MRDRLTALLLCAVALLAGGTGVAAAGASSTGGGTEPMTFCIADAANPEAARLSHRAGQREYAP